MTVLVRELVAEAAAEVADLDITAVITRYRPCPAPRANSGRSRFESARAGGGPRRARRRAAAVRSLSRFEGSVRPRWYR